jgi:nucleoside diphosphate kinase
MGGKARFIWRFSFRAFMTTERDHILVMVNPWARSQTPKILLEFDLVARRIATTRAVTLTLDDIDELYKHVQTKPFYQSFRLDLAAAPVVLALYEGSHEEVLVAKEHVRKQFPYSAKPFHKRLAVHTTESLAEFRAQYAHTRKYFETVRNT